MKKLSLLLIAAFVSVIGYGQTYNPDVDWKHSNPYAYDLRVTYSQDMKTMTFSYILNDNAIDNSELCLELDEDDLRGVKVYFYDKDGNRIPDVVNGNAITAFVPGANVVKGPYSFSRSASLFTVGQPYTWVVEVHGNEKRTKPQLITSATSSRPENAYGIAINNLPDRREFGQILVSRAKQVSDEYPCNTILEYTPQLTYVGRHDKKVHNGNTGSYFAKNSPNREPNRVKISEDGRVFVSSYHPNASAAVLEYLGAYKYREVVDMDVAANTDANDESNMNLRRRVIGMDVMGKGDNLKIVLAWIDANGYNGNEAKVEIYEYALGHANKDGYAVLSQIVGQTSRYGRTDQYVRKIGEYNAGALMYQSFQNGDYSEAFGFVDVAYDKYGNVWMKLDYADTANKTPGRIIWFKKDATPKEYVLGETRTDGFYGGSAILVTKDDVLFTGTGAGRIQAYDVDANGSFQKKDGWMVEDNSTATTRVGRWVTGLCMDYAGNLLALTEGSWTSGAKEFVANIVTIALPYAGQSSTPSPAISTFVPQNSNPIPNILATDLRYSYDQDNCIFTFCVNTKPKVAQIRFYETKANMLNSVNTVHGDLYDGKNSHKPCFVYNVPTSALKQGKITVRLGMCGGKLSGALDSEGCEIINDSLPAGEWYWSVYVEAPRRTTQFGVIYYLEGKTDPNDGDQRRYITVNNYPETDMFGSLFVGYNARTTDDATRGNRGLHIHGIKEDGNSNDEKADITSTTRYTLRNTYLNKNMEGMINYPRRLAVAPDGKVFIADEGNYGSGGGATIQYFERGGVKVWDPNSPKKFTTFSTNILGTSTGVAFWQHGSQWKLYATNTYDEFVRHGNNYTGEPSVPGTKDKFDNSSNAFGRNGYVEHLLNGNFSGYTSQTQRHYKKGDASGNIGIVAMDKGIWFCQHREHTVKIKKAIRDALADNLDAYILAFMPYGTNDKTWTSCTSNGINNSFVEMADASDFSQKENSPVQSTPGGGIAYRKYKVAGGAQKEYLFVPNHDGNIARVEIDSWSGNTPTVLTSKDQVKIFTTPEKIKGTKTFTQSGATVSWKTSFITSMEFDYAGNLVTTAGKGNHDAPQSIVIYTMPYPDRVNAQEIQAPNSCLFIPERLSQTGMNQDDVEPVVYPYIISPKNCTLDFYRTLQTGSFNSICLPFSLSSLSGTPYDGAEVMKFEKARLEEVGGEQHLYFDFVKVTSIEAGVPYLIQPKADVFEVKQFKSVKFEKSLGDTVNTGDYADFIGTFAQVNMDAPTTYPRFMVVSENCLAEIDGGTLLGFRSYFQMKKDITNTISLLNFKKPTTTDTEIVVDGQTVNVEKFIREGRAYIRVGETLYTITGEVVGDRL